MAYSTESTLYNVHAEKETLSRITMVCVGFIMLSGFSWYNQSWTSKKVELGSFTLF